MDGRILQHLWKIDYVDRSERAALRADAAASAELSDDPGFAVLALDYAFLACAIDRAQPNTEIIPAPQRVAFILLYNRYACHYASYSDYNGFKPLYWLQAALLNISKIFK